MGKKGSQKYLPALIFLSILLCTTQDVFCSGFAIYTQGASSLGQGAATIAHTEDPSAIFFNPALINKLDGIQILLGTTLIFPSRKFESDLPGSDTVKTEYDMFYPSTLFITNKLSDKLSAGVGVFNPFGLATKWPDDWEGRYITTNAEMRTYNINPVISYQIRPWITFAAGFDYLLLDATLENKINQLALVGNPSDAEQKFEGDGNGIGYNFGILIEPHKNISIGASYRSEIEVDIEGEVNHDHLDPLLILSFPNTDGEADLTLPQQVHAGVYYKGFYPLTFEAAMRWEGWSSYKQLKLKFDQPVAGMKTAVKKKNWKDTYSGNMGLKYQINESVALLAGYLYSGNPVPDKTFEPSIPDANTHLFTIGTDVKYKAFRFALAYGYQKLQDRDKNNSIDDNPFDPLEPNPSTSANGEYKSYLHIVGFSLTYMF